MAFILTQDQVLCVICMDSFTDPVSIPCGHNFCMDCIQGFWDASRKCECPLCKEAFQTRPTLRVNVSLKDITEQFKRSIKTKQDCKPEPAPRKNTSRRSLKSDTIPCDICSENKQTAVKSCLVCQASYCEMHLGPHLRDPVMMKHSLTDPATFSTRHLCRKHNRPLEMFCKKDQTPVCRSCTERDHKQHEIVPMEKESRRIKAHLKVAQSEIQQMIQNRLKKCEELKNSIELSRIDKDKEIQTSAHIASMAIKAIERNQALLIEEIEEKHEAAKRRGEDLIEELNQEIDELQRRWSELQYLKDTKDQLHLLQSFPCLTSPPSSTNWSEVSVEPDIYIRSVRASFSKLVDLCRELEKNLCAEEINKIGNYAVDVTLDPRTAANWLLLSPDGKKVSLSGQQGIQSLPKDPRRFDSCVAVLGQQSYTFGRRYWVVKVGDKTDWDLGVAKESINRKGSITVRPDNGYWAICRRKGESLRACAGPSVILKLQEIPSKVGVYLDYEDGSVSFYNADTKSHIYTYKGCCFTEPVYPYFNPCLHDNGRNTAPLIICPVETGLTLETAVH
ncbi:E3 ubiquitin-protein ligase TRIM21-like [Cyprinodon tularosa]|uniref:E3 ubiquitin-protein ligase TRIM21-like n=1 Tax=Cyprinodon tularosa TaxID=77115 RepID=UPI0018E253E9|nr:E3 ubiquitin-protein ligase TRIM21-like [Cyprinodon tularosa]